jgi:hypothetical protein
MCGTVGRRVAPPLLTYLTQVATYQKLPQNKLKIALLSPK